MTSKEGSLLLASGDVSSSEHVAKDSTFYVKPIHNFWTSPNWCSFPFSRFSTSSDFRRIIIRRAKVHYYLSHVKEIDQFGGRDSCFGGDMLGRSTAQHIFDAGSIPTHRTEEPTCGKAITYRSWTHSERDIKTHAL
ncbi:hypothetical protein TNCV_708241 [Trichonephila clavipes]|nr:hypothetical protein TNCV_708241 [Trichonephila clavipes]